MTQPIHLRRVASRTSTAGQTSCTTKVINWSRELEFGRRGISLDLKLSRIFRAHGTTTLCTRTARSSRSSAAVRRWPATVYVSYSRRRGRRSRCSFGRWAFLVSQADAAVADRDEWYEHVPETHPTGERGRSRTPSLFARASVRAGSSLSASESSRVAADAPFFERFLQRLRKSVEAPPVIAAPRVHLGADGSAVGRAAALRRRRGRARRRRRGYQPRPRGPRRAVVGERVHAADACRAGREAPKVMSDLGS